MAADPKTENQDAQSQGARRQPEYGITQIRTKDGRLLVTRFGMALVLGVSLRTVDRMVADEEIKPFRPHGWLVRFDVDEVLEQLRKNPNRKWGRKAFISGQSSVDGGQSSERRRGE